MPPSARKEAAKKGEDASKNQKNSYPLISFEHLRLFCEKTNICPLKKLDGMIKGPKKKQFLNDG